MLGLAWSPRSTFVMRQDETERPFVEIQLLQEIENRADACSRGSNLAVVGCRGVTGPKRLRRIVRSVRLEKVKEEEDRPVLIRLHPVHGDARGVAATALNRSRVEPFRPGID